MVRFTGGMLLFTVLSTAAPSQHNQVADRVQQVLHAPLTGQAGKPRKLQGRFLHITDIHPDPFYKSGTDPSGNHPCHAGKGEVDAGYYGAPVTECDSPFTLVDATFDWIERNIKDKIDFVIWTGDSARHDNDRDIPRSTKQVEGLNQFIVDKFVQTFGKPDNIDDPDPTNDFVVPIIPTFGNNDILPHNIFEPGPNKWTRKYIDIWSKFVPEDQYHSFERGGWFFTEVIPNKLAVFSLNTLYFFDSNVAVDGCDDHTEPGYEHMEWLRIQLQFLRTRGMKAILTGHVPPARTEGKQSWDETCYQKYTLWLRQYRDVIIGSLYGHMNIDHFMFQDVRDLTYKFKIPGIDDKNLRPKDSHSRSVPKDLFRVNAKATYLNDLRATWSDLPTPPKGVSYTSTDESTSDSISSKQTKGQKEKEKFLKDIGGTWGERFSLSLVSPSVVPNYFPTLRIIEYNITGLEHSHLATGLPQGRPAEKSGVLSELELESEPELESETEEDQSLSVSKKKKKKHDKKKHKTHKPNFRIPKPPSSTSPPGPAYSPQTFTFLSWTQLYANLTKIHEKMAIADDQAFTQPEAEQEDSSVDKITSTTTANKRDKHFTYKVEYTTNNDSTYHLHDLTLRSWLDIAERIGRTELHQTSIATSDDSMTNHGRSIQPSEQQQDQEYDDEKEKEGNGVDSSKKKNHGHRRKGKLSDNHLWHAFVKRAFVHTKADSDLEQDFG